jgi:hypothetical protein
MAECAFHPGVETNVRCQTCERPICPKDMVASPVGYKCRECARPLRSEYTIVKPRQLAMAAAVAVGVAVVAGFILMLVLNAAGFQFWLMGLIFGAAIGEAARRGSGGHREPSIAAVAGGAAALGALIAGLSPIGFVLSIVGAAGYVLGSRW